MSESIERLTIFQLTHLSCWTSTSCSRLASLNMNGLRGWVVAVPMFLFVFVVNNFLFAETAARTISLGPPIPKGPNERPNEAGSGSFKSGTFRPFPLYIPCLPLPHSLPLSLLPPSPGAQNREKTWNEQLEDEGALSLRRTPPAHSSPIPLSSSLLIIIIILPSPPFLFPPPHPL